MKIAYLDTHVALYLHAGQVSKLSKAAEREIERSELRMSPMALLELEYLYERKRTRWSAERIVDDLRESLGVQLCTIPFAASSRAAVKLGWTSDPFDRLIVGNAIAAGHAPLITQDETIRSNYRAATW